MPNPLETLRAQYFLVRELQEGGQFEAALRLALEMVSPARQAFGPDNAGLAELLSTIGILMRRTGRLADAEAPYLEALAIRRGIFPEDHPAVVVTRSNLAVLYFALERLDDAADLHRGVLAARRRKLSSNDPQIATTLCGLAAVHVKQGNLGEAEKLLDEALAIHSAARGAPSPGILEVLPTLATVYQLTGRRAAAGIALERVLTIARQTLPEGHPRLDELVREAAHLATEDGRFAAARPLWEEAIGISVALRGETDPKTLEFVANLALVCHRLGEHARAEELGRLALEQTRAAGGHPVTVAACLRTLGYVFRDTGRMADAEALVEESVASLRGAPQPDARMLALALSDLGSIHRRRGKDASAIRLFKEALEIQRGSPEAFADRRATLNNLAVLHLEARNHGAAEPLFREILGLVEKELAPEHPEQATARNNLAELCRETRRFAEAESLQKDANERYEKLGVPASLARGLINLGKLYAETDRPAEALDAFLRAAELDDRTIGEVFAFASERHRLEYVSSILENLYGVVSLVVEHLPSSVDAVRGAFDLVLRRKAIGLEALAAQRDLTLGGRYPDLLPAFRRLTAVRAEIARASMDGVSTAEMEARKERMEAELARALAEADAGGLVRPVTRGAVAAKLPRGGVLIEIVRYPRRDFRARVPSEPLWGAWRYVAFLLDADRPDEPRLVDLGDAAPIEDAIVRFRASLGIVEGAMGASAVVATASPDAAAEDALTSRLVDPIVAKLDGRKRLLVAPDGDLARLPFEVLLLRDGRRAIAAYEISYLGTGRDALRFGERPAASTAPVVVADPDFGAHADAGTPPPRLGRGDPRYVRDLEAFSFAPLPATRVEGERIAALLGVTPMLGGQALEGRLRECHSPRVLHIATHGWFLPEATRVESVRGPGGVALAPVPAEGGVKLVMVGKAGDEGFAATMTIGPGRMGLVGLQSAMLRSGLALAGANTWLRKGALPDGAEDGMLTAEDVSALDLSSTELVVLSACDTGLGDARLADGVLGLRRACAIAGARTLVMSLWKVPDDATLELMTGFYQRIMRGEPRADALREAQRDLASKHPSPLYWGAFICQGDPGPWRGE